MILPGWKNISIYVQRALQLHFWITCDALFVNALDNFRYSLSIIKDFSNLYFSFVWKISSGNHHLWQSDERNFSTLVSKEHEFKIEFQERVKECVKFAVKLFQHFDRQQRRESGEKSLLISSLWNFRRSFTSSFEWKIEFPPK